MSVIFRITWPESKNLDTYIYTSSRKKACAPVKVLHSDDASKFTRAVPFVLCFLSKLKV